MNEEFSIEDKNHLNLFLSAEDIFHFHAYMRHLLTGLVVVCSMTLTGIDGLLAHSIICFFGFAGYGVLIIKAKKN